MNESDLFFPERRHHQRTQLQVTLRGLRLDPDGDLVDILHMLDISRGGMGAIVDRPYYRGQRVVLSQGHHDDAQRITKGVVQGASSASPAAAGEEHLPRLDDSPKGRGRRG